MAQAAHTLSGRFFGGSSYLAWAVFFGAITTLMAIGGPVLMVKQWLEKFAVWAVLLSAIWLTDAVVISYDRKGSGGQSDEIQETSGC